MQKTAAAALQNNRRNTALTGMAVKSVFCLGANQIFRAGQRRNAERVRADRWTCCAVVIDMRDERLTKAAGMKIDQIIGVPG